MKNVPALRIDSLFAAQFSISVSKKSRAILLFAIKIIEMFELCRACQGCDSLNIKRIFR